MRGSMQEEQICIYLRVGIFLAQKCRKKARSLFAISAMRNLPRWPKKPRIEWCR